MKDAGEAMTKFLRGELSAEDYARFLTTYFESPDWRRRKAALATETLRHQKEGRTRLLELIAKAEADGYLVQTEFVPLGEGHDSLLVRVEGHGTGFPSYLTAQAVDANFSDIMKDADARFLARHRESGQR